MPDTPNTDPAPSLAPSPAAAPAVLAACLRLDTSRHQLRLALQGPATAAALAGTAPPGWWARLSAVPGVGMLMDAARHWWAKHPWHTAGTAVATAANGLLQPMAKRHPWALVAAALLAGGLVAAARPWRWPAQAASGAAGTLPRLLSEALTAMPVATWLLMLTTVAQAAGLSAAAAPPPEPDAPPAPPAPPAPFPAASSDTPFPTP